VGPRLNVGKAVLAGLEPAIHAAPPQISRLLRLPSIQRLIMRLQVFAWMAGSSPAMPENRIRSPPTANAIRAKLSKFEL
jgi:hypothetical protein